MTTAIRFPAPELSAAETAFAQTPSVLALLKVWNARIKSRRALKQLDAHLLADIGYTAHELHMEASKPFWQA